MNAPKTSSLEQRRRALLAKGGPWNQRIGAFARVPELIRQLGGDAAASLAAVGLPADALGDPHKTVPYASLVQLVDEAARRTACNHFGLLAGRMWHLSDLGLVGRIVLNSRTVGDALQALTVYQHLNSAGGMPFVLRGERHVEFGYAIYDPGVVHTAQMHDVALASGMNIMRGLCGQGWAPSEVLFSHSRPEDASPYRNLFKVAPRFDSEVNALRFPATWMHHVVEGASPGELRYLLAEASRAGRCNLVQRVCRALRVLMLQGRNSGDDVAQMLSMHRRTLNRRLKEEGTTFQAVLDEVRFELARELLDGQNITLDDVAAALGYAGVSPFMRTFRRWTGTTPGQWRREATAPAREGSNATGG